MVSSIPIIAMSPPVSIMLVSMLCDDDAATTAAEVSDRGDVAGLPNL